MIDFEFEFQYAEAKLPILRQVGGGIPAGRCVVLCGGSGCGKSTLLRCINGLIPQFYEGELKGFCRLNGQDTDVYKRQAPPRFFGQAPKKWGGTGSTR